VQAGEGAESRAELTAALQSYDRGMKLARDRSEYGSGLLADVLVYLQQHDRAIDILTDRAARTRTSYIDQYKLARFEQSAGRSKEEWQNALVQAREFLAEQLKSHPEDAVALSYLALVQTRLGLFKDAVSANKQALAIAPRNVDVLYNTARMYTLQREKSKALEALEKAVDRRYSLSQMLDMDFFNLRSEEGFLSVVSE
jgi:tetratricopeptide (TPR) repeat protein